MRVLNVFLDESGDLGFNDYSSSRFILSFVFHDADEDISEKIRKINGLGYIHVAPLIRKEKPYQDDDLETRIKMFRKFFSFFRDLPIKCKSFVYDKRRFENRPELIEKQIKDDLSGFFKITNHYLVSFGSIVFYYDRGNKMMGKILEDVLNSSGLPYSFKEGVKAEDYRLFQVADLITLIKHIEYKSNDEGMTASENRFFERPRRLKKYYLKAIENKEI